MQQRHSNTLPFLRLLGTCMLAPHWGNNDYSIAIAKKDSPSCWISCLLTYKVLTTTPPPSTGLTLSSQEYELLHLTKENTWKPYFLFCEFFKSNHQALSPSYLPWEPSTSIPLPPFNKTSSLALAGIEIRAGHPLLLNISFPPLSSPPFYPRSFVAISKTGNPSPFTLLLTASFSPKVNRNSFLRYCMRYQITRW